MIKSAPDLRLLWAPAATYREIAGLPADGSSWVRAAARVATPALVAGIATAITATHRITWSLALTGMACWTLLSVLQLMTAAPIVLSSRRSVPLARTIELFFLGHAAWSLWLLAAAAAVFTVPRAIPFDALLFSACVPFIWTGFVTFAFCRHVLGLERRPAAVRALIHQSLTGLVVILYLGWAVQLWPRILSLHTP